MNGAFGGIETLGKFGFNSAACSAARFSITVSSMFVGRNQSDRIFTSTAGEASPAR